MYMYSNIVKLFLAKIVRYKSVNYYLINIKF